MARDPDNGFWEQISNRLWLINITCFWHSIVEIRQCQALLAKYNELSRCAVRMRLPVPKRSAAPGARCGY